MMHAIGMAGARIDHVERVRGFAQRQRGETAIEQDGLGFVRETAMGHYGFSRMR